MTVNQKKSLVAFYISKYNDAAYRELGYNGTKNKALEDLSIRITGPDVEPNAYIRQRRDEFDVFFDNGRVGYCKRKPKSAVTEMYEKWNIMSFEEITELVKAILDGKMEEEQVLNLKNIDEKISEHDIEAYLNFSDDTAALNTTVKTVVERTYSKTKVDMLKRLYAYKCQICEGNIGEEYETNIAEVHHIKYFSKSIDNSSDNLLILCPNHHRLIHALNPEFDYDELQYLYPNGKIDKIALDFHLTYGKEEK
ncbi:MAG: HNH endonuclease [Lachnospiraceae bacterium]|nr:HNH endonuclease [Lachnospiraceae bacterium]